MKIIENGDTKRYTISPEQIINVAVDKYGGIEVFEEKDVTHTGHYFKSLQDFFYYINGLTEIARKLKEQEEEDE